MTEHTGLSRGIPGSTLKLIAIITMMIDHTGATVLRAILRLSSVTSQPDLLAFWNRAYSWSRSIGRIAFPIFCFLIVEGFVHTRSVKRYAWRLFLFALISELPFDIALKGNWYYPQKQNVYFTLLIGLLVIAGISAIEKKISAVLRTGKQAAVFAFSIPVIALGMYLALRIDTDYNYKGVFLIAVLYLSRRIRLFQCMAGAAAVSWELPAPIGFLPVYLYNGKRGLRMKYFFYWFYPVHLLILFGLSEYVIPLLG